MADEIFQNKTSRSPHHDVVVTETYLADHYHCSKFDLYFIPNTCGFVPYSRNLEASLLGNDSWVSLLDLFYRARFLLELYVLGLLYPGQMLG